MATLKKGKEYRKNQIKHKQDVNRIMFVGIAIVVLGITGLLLIRAFYKPPLPTAGNVIDISADMGGFDKTEITVKVGEPVTIRLRSMDTSGHTDGGGKHQWAVDDFSVSVIAPPLGTEIVTFTPTKTGTFTFYCDICCGGRANPSMNGTLIVEA